MKGKGGGEGYINAFQSSDLDHGYEILMRGLYAMAQTIWETPEKTSQMHILMIYFVKHVNCMITYLEISKLKVISERIRVKLAKR